MPTYVDELSLHLSARDDLSARTREVRKELTATERAMSAARKEFEDTGAPAAAAQLRKLEREYVDLLQTQAKERKALAAEEAQLKRLRAEVGRSQSAIAKMGRAWTGTASVFNNNLVAGASVAGLAMWGRNAVNTYAAVQDAQDAQTASFGRNGEALVAWGDRMGDRLNLSKKQAYEATQTFAVMADTAGIGGEALVDFSTGLTDRAANAASYFGGSVEDAITAFSAALRGESEPARRYGVMLDDMSLRQQAVRMGIIATTKTALTPQQKVLAAQALVMRQTERVIGDIDRTSDSMGNTLKDNAQQMADFQASAGEAVAKGLQPVLNVGNDALDMFNELPDGLKQAAVGIGLIGTAALIATPRLATLNANLEKTRFGSLRGLASASRGAILPLGLFTAATVAGSLALDKMSTDASETQASIEGLKGSFDALTGAMSATGKQHVTTQLATDIDAGDWGTLARYGLSLETVTKAVSGTKEEFDRLKAAINAANDNSLFNWGDAYLLRTLGRNVDGMRQRVDGVRVANEAAAKAAEITDDSLRGLADAHSYAAWKAREQSAAEKGLTDSIAAGQRVLQQREAFRNYQDALKAFQAKPNKETGDAVDAALFAWVGTFKKSENQQKAFGEGFDGIAAAAKKTGKGLEKYVLGPLKESKLYADQIAAALAPGSIQSIVMNSKIYSMGPGLADGGYAYGPGTATSDSIPALLSNGEHVTRAHAASAMRSAFGSDVMGLVNNFDRAPERLVARIAAPRTAVPRIVVKAGTSQTMTTNVTATSQIDYELAQRRMARQAARESRARYAGSR